MSATTHMSGGDDPETDTHECPSPDHHYTTCMQSRLPQIGYEVQQSIAPLNMNILHVVPLKRVFNLSL